MSLKQKTLLPFETSGDEKSKDCIVFLHGYPDTTEVWKEVQNKVNQNAFIVSISYPNYSEKDSSIFGLSQPEVVRRLGLIIAGFQSVHERQITIVAHDWGAYIAYMFDKQNPGLLKQLITLDIAAWNEKKIKNLMVILSYQLPLMLAFLIGFFIPFLGNYITKRVVQGFFKYRPPHESRITWKWNYFYLYFFVNFLKSIIWPKSAWLSDYIPKTPIVYIYAENKPQQFHSLKWIQFLQSVKGSEVLSVDCSHWIPIHKPDFVAEVIKRRLLH